MDDITIKTYDQAAREYDEETAQFWDMFPVPFITTFASYLPKPGRVLNVGSGPGRDGSLLYATGLNVVCLDASHAMVEMSKARGLLSVQSDFLHIPFEDKSFNAVWAYTALLHIKKSELPKALVEIARVLDLGGVLGLGMIEGEGESYRESSGISMPRWFAFYTKEELGTALGQAGFEVVNFETFKPRSKNYLNFIARKVK